MITGSGSVSSSALHHAQRVRQRALQLLALGDVGVRARSCAARRPLGVALGDAAIRLEPHPAAVGMAHAMLDLKHRRDAAQHVAQRIAERRDVVGVDEVDDRRDRPDFAVGRVSDELEVRVVAVDVAGREVPFPQAEVREAPSAIFRRRSLSSWRARVSRTSSMRARTPRRSTFGSTSPPARRFETRVSRSAADSSPKACASCSDKSRFILTRRTRPRTYYS